MNICYYVHSLPNPLIGGVERVTYNLAQYFSKHEHQIYYLTLNGEHSGRIPSQLSDIDKMRFINEYLRRNKIDILIDQYATSFIRHPEIDKAIKIVRCHHLNPFAKHLMRSLFEVFSFRNLRYSLLNIAFALNIPRSSFLKYRSFSKLLKTRGVDKIVYLSNSYIFPISKRYKVPLSLLSAIPNPLENCLIPPPP